MEYEKDPFLIPLIESLNSSDQHKNDITKVIYNFQHQISSSLFSKYSDEIILKIFKDIIWIFLLNNAGSPSSSTRLAAYHATGAFLTRITPYYPQLIYNSFMDITKQMTVDVKSSAVIASSFAFISTYVAEPFLASFLSSTPVFHHFATSDPSFSEHLAVIISKLGHLGTQWMENLLQYFLERISEKQDRYIIRAIAAIVSNDPNHYIQIILNFVKSDFRKYLSFLTFVILNHQDSLSSIDLMPVVLSAIDTLKDSESNLADFDSALQFLSINSTSFHFKTETTTETECTIKISNDAGLTKEATINLEKVTSIPSFYSLNLPLDLLRPNPEKDSILVLTAKFRTIASISSFDINEVFSIFEPYITNEYNEITSAAIQGFSYCINRILNDIPNEKLNGTLKKVLFSTKSSWYHAFDVLRVIKNIDISLFIQKIGYSFFAKLIECLTDFCYYESDLLAQDSLKVLTDLTHKSNCKLVIDSIFKRTDYFDEFNISKTVKALTSILTKTNCSDFLGLFSQHLLESVPLYFNSLNLLSSFFQYFSIYKCDPKSLESVLSAAYCIIFVTVELISGKTIKTQLKIKKLVDFKSLVSRDINTKNVDIITQPGNDYKIFMNPMKCSLEFIFNNAQPEEAIATAMICDRLFPYECSLLYEQKWDMLSKIEKDELFSNLAPFLKFIGDERVHATWCRIALKTEKFESNTGLFDLLREMATFFLNNDYSNKDEQITASYIQFIHEFTQSTELITQYLDKIDNEMKVKTSEIYPKIRDFTTIHPIEKVVKEIEIPQVEPKVEEVTIPEDIDNEKIIEYLNHSIKYINMNLLENVLQIASTRNLTINYVNQKVPAEFIPLIANYMSEHLPEIIDDALLNEALSISRTLWRVYSISLIKKSPNKLIENLILSDKVKKHDILCLSTLINQISFDNHLLFKLASKLILSSKTAPRYRVALKFLGPVISNQKAISTSFLSELIHSVTLNMEKVDANGLAFVLFLAAQKVGVDQDFISFSKSILNLCGNKSPGHSRIIQILIGVSSNIRFVGRSFYSDLSEIVMPFLQSSLPSRYCSGLRLFEQACLSIDSKYCASFFNCIDTIIDKYQPSSRYLSTNIAGRNAILAFANKQGIPNQQLTLYRNYSSKVVLNSYSAGFIASVAILPSLINSISLNNENVKLLFSLIDTLFKYNTSCYVGLLSLESRIKRISTKAEKQHVILTTLENWIKAGKDRNIFPSYDLIKQINGWYKLFQRNLDSPLKILRTMCVQLISFVPFGYIFPVLVNCYIKDPKNDDINSILYEISTKIEKHSHKESIIQLKRQIFGEERNKRIIELGFFEEDCDESDKLIDVLQHEE